MYPLLARGRDRLETMNFAINTTVLSNLLLARGRDRLETCNFRLIMRFKIFLLLARGRDRLETEVDRGNLRLRTWSPTR